MVTGDVVIVPTVVLALVTFTNAEVPPARACEVRNPPDESSRAERTVIFELPLSDEVKNSPPACPNGDWRTKPDFDSVTGPAAPAITGVDAHRGFRAAPFDWRAVHA